MLKKIKWTKWAAIVLSGVLMVSGLVGLPGRGAANSASSHSGKWESLGDPFNGYDPYTPSVVFDSSGTPYVGFLNPEATVKKFNGISWVTVGNANFPGKTISVIKLAMGTDDSLYALTGDPDSVNKLTLWKYAGTGWSVLGPADFTPSIQNSSSFGYLKDHVAFALASDNTPYVAFPNSGQRYKLTVMRFNSSDTLWETVGGDAILEDNKQTVTNTSMAIGANDNVYVTIKYGNDMSRLRSIFRFDGKSWSNLGDDVLNGMQFNTRSAAPIAISAGDQLPYIFVSPLTTESPYSMYESKMLVYRDSQWEQVGSAIDGTDSTLFNFALAPDTTAYATTMDSETNVTSVVKLAPAEGSEWETILTETDSFLRIVALAVSPEGNPYIVVTSSRGVEVKYYAIVDAAPSADNVSISGKMMAGQTLKGTYSYSDAEGAKEGASLFSWEVADDANGTNGTAIVGANLDQYELQSSQKGKYVRFVVTPVAMAGTATGAPAASDWKAVSSLNLGDANGDGIITPADALLAIKYTQSKIQLTPEQIYALDVDNSGTVDEQDAQLILRLFVGVN
ncbi:dockerin type I domain-containing protein [Paenibacillus cymbidii]|uniref:dockerin type I domain-containing protein n=1 Tax=Paenibacillus cymbidii TaxID=1639034 RepID=UPI001081EE05|nr:dockerin type I domain-containing protein [Paenibacillus cymbidii]